MPEKEFDLYLSLLSRLLRLSPEQKASIDNELRDHLEARFEELVRKGVPRDEAIQWALDEFGDAAGLAQEFTKLSRRNIRRWIMRCTLATAAMGAVVLLVVNAFLPEQRGVPMAQHVVAQDKGAAAAPGDAGAATVEEGDVVRIDPAEFLPPQLSQPIDLELVDVPLRDAAQLISERIGAPVFFDERSLDEAGITGDQPITEAASREPVYLVLDRIVRNIEGKFLAWHWEDDILHITTPDKNQERLSAVSYNVRDLLQSGYSLHQLATVVQEMSHGPWSEYDGMGGSLSEFGDLLVVSQNQTTHREIAALLKALRVTGRERRVLEPALHEKLREHLNARITVDFVDTPLSDALAHINATQGTNLRLDRSTLSDAGVSGDASVTLTLADRPLRTVLKYLLQDVQDVECSAVILHGAIWVTTKELADENLTTVVYDVSDIVGGDTERSAALMEVIENQTQGPWQRLDGIGGGIVAPVPDIIVVRQTELVQAEVAAFLAEHRAAVASAAAAGDVPERDPRLREVVETRYYTMDADTANDLLTVLPESVDPGTWASTVGSDGRPVPLNANGIGTIRKVAAGHKVLHLGGELAGLAGSGGQTDGGATGQATPEAGTGKSEVMVVPQAVLIITHKRSVHREIRDFLQKLQGSTDGSGVNGGFGGGGFMGGGGFGGGGFIGGGGLGGFDGRGGGFFSVTTPE